MAKKTWDKAIAAAPTIDNRFTQDDWQKIDRTVPADPNQPAADPEVRYYNPSGPFYDEKPPHTHVPPAPLKETK